MSRSDESSNSMFGDSNYDGENGFGENGYEDSNGEEDDDRYDNIFGLDEEDGSYSEGYSS